MPDLVVPFYQRKDGEEHQAGNAHICIEKQVYVYRFTWMRKLEGKTASLKTMRKSN